VDFAVHAIERLGVLLRDERRSLDESIAALFPSAGRALLFSFIALNLGSGVLAVAVSFLSRSSGFFAPAFRG